MVKLKAPKNPASRLPTDITAAVETAVLVCDPVPEKVEVTHDKKITIAELAPHCATKQPKMYLVHGASAVHNTKYPNICVATATMMCKGLSLTRSEFKAIGNCVNIATKYGGAERSNETEDEKPKERTIVGKNIDIECTGAMRAKYERQKTASAGSFSASLN